MGEYKNIIEQKEDITKMCSVQLLCIGCAKK